ncbi:hypothetical protein LPB142_10120 [Rhodobacter xanthinilyticus]|uniref:Uncharacterized protein n=1 Tax=Rhodobacter xanthinilyticus TaxID=1850250 RepID=A0A1D9MCW3_9RHOB|nr:hypothetical protein [Rhodobacter xanthinilyticus]AOZ69628.1 hypothetical protein LPB142_10120 [Rhodobacter xanthinilyticus]
MNVLRRLWREQRLAMIGFGLALGLMVFFGARTVSRALYWADPAHLRQTPEPWMTPGYIARSWHLPNGALVDLLGAPQEGKGRQRLADIARARGIPVEVLIDELTRALPQIAPLPEGADPDAPAPGAPQ